MKRMREVKCVNVSSITGVILEGTPEDRMRDHTLPFAPVRHRKYSPPVSTPVTPTFQQNGMMIERGGKLTCG